jgi:hypothetical protein
VAQTDWPAAWCCGMVLRRPLSGMVDVWRAPWCMTRGEGGRAWLRAMRDGEDAMGVMVPATFRQRAPMSRLGRAEVRVSQAYEATPVELRGQQMTGAWCVVSSAAGGARDVRYDRAKVCLLWLLVPSGSRDSGDLQEPSSLRYGWPAVRIPGRELAAAVASCGDGGGRLDLGRTMGPARVPGGLSPWAVQWSSLVGWTRLSCMMVGNACVWSVTKWAWAVWAYRCLTMQGLACACRGPPFSTSTDLGFLLSFTYLFRRLVHCLPLAPNLGPVVGVIRDLR